MRIAFHLFDLTDQSFKKVYFRKWNGRNPAFTNAQKIADKWIRTKHPQLNKDQQIVLEYLKNQSPTGKPMQGIFWMMNNAAWGKLDEIRKPIMHLTDKQQAQVLEEFGKWVQEQEE